MSLFSRSTKFFILALASILLLAGCTLSPVYTEGAAQNYAIEYSKPSSLTDQTIIQELAFKLGRSKGAPKYALVVSSSTAVRTIFSVGSTFPRQEYETTVRSTFVLTSVSTGEQMLKASRFATAIYQGSSQNIANNQAKADAYQRAAKDVARQGELLIISAINEDQS